MAPANQDRDIIFGIYPDSFKMIEREKVADFPGSLTVVDSDRAWVGTGREGLSREG